MPPMASTGASATRASSPPPRDHVAASGAQGASPPAAAAHLSERERRFHRVEQLTELPMLALAIAFLLVVALPELVHDLPRATLDALEAVGWVIWVLFAAELLLKTYLAPRRLAYLRSHWLDVLVVLFPFLRPLRLLLLVLAGARFWAEAQVLLRRHTFGFLGVTSIGVVVLAGVLMYAVERGGDGSIQTFGDALWWAAATITTVGYGDVYPKTHAGRAIAVLLMLSGISLFGVLTARVAAFFVEGDEAERLRHHELISRLDLLERQNRELRERLDEGR